MHELAEILYGDAWVAEWTAAIGVLPRHTPGDIHLSSQNSEPGENILRGEYVARGIPPRGTRPQDTDDHRTLHGASRPYGAALSDHKRSSQRSHSGQRFTRRLYELRKPRRLLRSPCRNSAERRPPRRDNAHRGAVARKGTRPGGPAPEDILGWTLGATGRALARTARRRHSQKRGTHFRGGGGAHLSGFPLNQELISHGRNLYAKRRPVRITAFIESKERLRRNRGSSSAKGMSIDVEIWSLSPSELECSSPEFRADDHRDDRTRKRRNPQRFLCEPCALQNAEDITAFGGWENYISSELERTDLDKVTIILKSLKSETLSTSVRRLIPARTSRDFMRRGA